MSPRWGFKTFGHPVCYKHVAPLGIKTGNTRPLYMLGRKTGDIALCSQNTCLDSDDDAEA